MIFLTVVGEIERREREREREREKEIRGGKVVREGIEKGRGEREREKYEPHRKQQILSRDDGRSKFFF